MTGITVQTIAAITGKIRVSPVTIGVRGDVAGVRTGAIIAGVKADRIEQNGELGGITCAMVGAMAASIRIVFEGIGVFISAGMTPGAIGAVFVFHDSVNCGSDSGMQVGAITMSTNTRGACLSGE